MTNVSWGIKRSCPKCSARFYDLNAHPAECPKCAHSFDPAAMLKPRRGRARKFSNLTPETEADDALFNSILAKTGKPGGKKAAVSEDDLEDGKDTGLVEDAEEIEEFESLKELESMEEKTDAGDEADEEAIMEDFSVDGEEIVDKIEDGEDEEEAEGEEEERPKAGKRRR